MPFGDHGGADGGVGRLVDEDQAAGQPVPGVRVAEQRLGQPQAHPADLVQPEPAARLVPVQGVHVEPVVQVADDRLDRPRGVLDDQPAARRPAAGSRTSSRPSLRRPG